MVRVNGKRHNYLMASSIIEVVIASMMFLLIFCLCMEMMVRINNKGDAGKLLQIATDRNECIREVKNGEIGFGNYSKKYDWGEIIVKVQSYTNLPELRQIHLTGTMSNGKKIFEYRTLVEQ